MIFLSEMHELIKDGNDNNTGIKTALAIKLVEALIDWVTGNYVGS